MIMIQWNPNLSNNIPSKAGFYLKAVFPPHNLGLMRNLVRVSSNPKACHSFHESMFCGVCKFREYLGGDSFSQWISEIRNVEDLI